MQSSQVIGPSLCLRLGFTLAIATAQIYKYPAGGDPINGIDTYGFGVTVSAAK